MTNNTTIAVDLGKDITYELIVEYLGGYEKAKLRLISTDKRLGYTHLYLHEGRYCFLDDYVDYIPDCAISIKSALNALLEYRRAHNIFEVGDQIAYLPKCAPEHNDIYEVREVHQSWCLVVLGNMDHRAIYTNIRHTTDAEIKANRRLDQ